MMDPQSPFALILAQTRQNIQLLIAHKQIPESDGNEILSKLEKDGSITSLTQITQRMTMSPGLQKVEARAIWDWTSEDPNDLSFEAGDVVEILTETNADWWTGRNRSGKQGLFPSNYVEKQPPRSMSPRLVPEPRRAMRGPGEQRYGSPAFGPNSPPGPPQTNAAAPQYYPPPAGYYPPAGGPPPGGNYYPPPAAPPPAQAAPVPQEAPKKNNKFGGLGQVLAQSAATGVGWGAGAAIGGDLVNALF